MTPSATTANRQIARAAGTVMAAFVLSNLTGLVRQVLVSRAFGTQEVMDAFNAASFLPTLLFTLVAGGALASAFVPTYTGFLAGGDWEGGWKLASAILNLVTLALTGFAILSAVFAPQIVRYGLYALEPDIRAEVVALTTELLRILLLSPILFGISGLFMGVLNANQVFLLPALAPSMYWLGMIFGVLALAPSMGIYGLAWGAVIGAGLHLGVQLPAIFRIGWQYTLRLGLALPAVREVGRLMVPRLLGVGVVQLNFWLNILLATAQPEGSLTAIQVAFAVMTMPQVVIAQAIAIAALPTFSAQAARGDLADMRQSLAATLRGIILLSLPASAGLILLRQPVVAMLFQRGEFTARSTELVAWALLWYSAGLVGHSVVEVVSRSFYALHDTKTPVLVGAAAMGLNLAFSVLFSALFLHWGWMPHGGLALANSLATAIEMGGLLWLMRRRLGGLEGRDLLAGTAQAALATLAMSMVILAWSGWAGGKPAWLVSLVGIALGGGVYALVVVALQVREARLLAEATSKAARKLLR